MIKSLVVIIFFFTCSSIALISQNNHWQQRADYEISIDFNSEKNTFGGIQSLTYFNNSPDTLNKLFFHLYYNAFQPNSQMDIMAQRIPDPMMGLDWKLKYLTSAEKGKMMVTQVIQDSKMLEMIHHETILEVFLAEPIPPNGKQILEMSFYAQVPVMTRRTGRDNEEGIDYSMSQWYPKICVYNEKGWQATSYIGREFHSNFGDYKVNIRMDSSYVLAAGCDKVSVDTISASSKKNWEFISKNVIDFAWAADQDYQHYSVKTEGGIDLHFYFQEEQNKKGFWNEMSEPLLKVFPYISLKYGQYPYSSFSFIQAGDGGMEYPKCTFITGDRGLGSLVGLSVHEIMHNWYQSVVASQENEYAWMDEGLASFAATEIKEYMAKEGIYFTAKDTFAYLDQYKDYALIARSGLEETMNTPSNFFFSNTAYNMASYTKGEIFFKQLEYIIGEEAFDQGLKKYFKDWSFAHPIPSDLIRVMENTSGIELDWYEHFWLNTTDLINYAVEVDSLNAEQSMIRIQNKGSIPMPIDVNIQYKDGSVANYIIPLDLMYGNKKVKDLESEIILQAWPWTHPEYNIMMNLPATEIEKIIVDKSLRLADIDRSDNLWPADE